MKFDKITTRTTHPVVLGSAAYPGVDLLITATGTVAPSIQGVPAILAAAELTPVTIVNQGFVHAAPGTANAPTGAVGVEFAAGSGLLANSGTLEGGRGGVVVAGPASGTGGTAVLFSSYGTLANSGLIEGGNGGAGSANSEPYFTYAGMGGTGVAIAFGALTNTGLIAGGRGGYIPPAGYANGGGGGIGVDLSLHAELHNFGTIIGGLGTLGYYSSGNGGVGVQIETGAGAATNAGLIEGGHGGDEDSDYSSGEGGKGVVIDAGASLRNAGTIMGGLGGLGQLSGGDGGDGAAIYGGTLTNAGTVGGGAAGYNSPTGPGAGVLIDGGRLINAGTIEGGGKGLFESYGAIAFASGGGTAELLPGSSLLGAISGWQNYDYIILPGVAATSEEFTPGTGGQPGILTLYGATGQVVETLAFTGALTTESFSLGTLTDGATEIGFGH